jgi:hypothetical protein
MKALSLVLAVLPLACSVGTSKLDLDLGNEPFVADGSTARTIKVCNDSDEPAASVVASLRATNGSWQDGKATDPQSIDLTLTAESHCATADWIPPTKEGSIGFEVEVGGAVVARDSGRIRTAEVDQIELQAGLLSDTDASSIQLGIDFTTKTLGAVTDGTVVTLRVSASTPAGHAYLSSSSVVAGKRDNVTLFATAGTTSVQIEAKLKSDPTVMDCKVVTPTGVEACP